MIDRLKPYPNYKDSGVPWLGEVPEHWEVRRVKTFCRMSYGESLITSNRENGIFPVFGSNGRVDFHRLSNTQAPCIVIGRKGSFGKVNYSEIPVFAIDTTFFIDQRHTKTKIRWLFYLLQCLNLDEVSKDSAVPGLERDDAYNRFVILPQIDEQAAIVRFLDYVDRRIRRYIRAKQKLIKLLEEMKAVTIQRAVTGQIDVRTGKPYPKYKPSGVEWLGEVPEHWGVKRLKNLSKINPSKAEAVSLLKQDIMATFLSMERVSSDGRIDASEQRPISELWNGFTYFRKGDVIVAKITPCFENGKGAYLGDLPSEIGFGSTEFHVLRSDHLMEGTFLYQLTILPEFRRRGAEEMTGAAGQQRVPSSFIASFLAPIPPLPEQAAIVKFLDKASADIDTSISRTQNQISLLREYRTRMISDVVTGKLDVREAAAKLPEESEEPEHFDETDAVSVSETADETSGDLIEESEEVGT